MMNDRSRTRLHMGCGEALRGRIARTEELMELSTKPRTVAAGQPVKPAVRKVKDK
jgi:hypothetical protein